jgi:membrane-associated PAP2 superfamily phosphatase
MNRTGLTVALAVAGLTGFAFGIFPELDLRLAQLFGSGAGFALVHHPWLWVLREANTIVVALLVAPAVLAVVCKLVLPDRPLIIPGRAVVYLVGTLLIAPLVVANMLLKDHWGRPRPRDIGMFGGNQQFVAWWDPRGTCEGNCSFVAGEAAGAFWTMAPASLAPPQWRPLAYAGALAFGTGIGLLRMAFGAHFFTDVVFAGVLTFIVIWIVHGLLYRWPTTRLPDTAVERVLARIGTRIRGLFTSSGVRGESLPSGSDPKVGARSGPGEGGTPH